MDHQLSPHLWVNLHADYLYSFAILRIQNDEQARDLVQDTFLAGLENRGSFKGTSAERTWLTAILKHKITDIHRKNAKGHRQISTEDEKYEEDHFFHLPDGHWNKKYAPKAIGTGDMAQLEKKEFDIIIRKCVQKLPALWMAVFTMKHIDDQATNIICAELKVSPANFWVIIHRAKLNLRACLQKNWI